MTLFKILATVYLVDHHDHKKSLYKALKEVEKGEFHIPSMLLKRAKCPIIVNESCTTRRIQVFHVQDTVLAKCIRLAYMQFVIIMHAAILCGWHANCM